VAVETSSGKPYTEFNLINGDRLRLFRHDVSEEDLVWHRDKETRTIFVEENIDWKLQLDDELPFILEIGRTYIIPKMVYHRLIKGTSELLIRLQIL
jgi:hypothetical protein